MTSHGWNFGVSDIINLPTSQGSGYVLAPDGSGGLTWIATSSIGVTDHGALTGLADDDHTQYILASGTRTGAVSQRQTFTNAVDTSAYYEIGTTKYLHVAGGVNNLWVGKSVGANITTGTANVALGYRAGEALTTGYNNTFLGPVTGATVQAGYSNIAIGLDAMGEAGTTNAVLGNLAIGYGALKKVTADGNLAIGTGALTANTSGQGNIAIGSAAMSSNLTGYNNLAIGINALTGGNTTGYNNIALADYAGYGVVNRNSNVFIGSNAGASSDMNGCFAIGQQAGQYVGTKINNVYLGTYAGKQSTGSQCLYLGTFAGALSKGDFNIGIGDSALYNMGASATGAVTAIGRGAGNAFSGAYGATFVGYESGNASSGWNAVGVGAATLYGNTRNYVIAIGANAGYGNTYYRTIFIGAEAKNATADGQCLIGADFVAGYIDNFFLGSGVISTSASSRGITVQASGGSGTNNAGASHRVAGGKGTGNAAGGSLIFAVAPAGSSGSSLNSLFDWLTIASTKIGTLGEASDLAFGTTTGTKFGTATTQKIGFWNVTPVVQPSAYTQTYSTADKTLAAYTADTESSAYTGIDNAQGGTPYAQLTDLNALRVAYENLRAFTEDLAQHHNSVVDDLQTIGLVG